MTREVLKMALEALENIDNWLPTIGQRGLRDYEADAITAIRAALVTKDFSLPEQCTGCEGKPSNTNNPCAVCGKAQPEHPEQMARLGWQYFECPACGSEGARAFPKPEQWTPEDMAYRPGGLAQPEQEPAFYGFLLDEECCVNICYSPCGPGGPNNELPTAYYTSPPKRQPLTNEQINDIDDAIMKSPRGYVLKFARAIEAAHGIGEKT